MTISCGESPFGHIQTVTISIHRPFTRAGQETKLVQCLNAFKKGGTHMGLVRKAQNDGEKHGVEKTELKLQLKLEVCHERGYPVVRRERFGAMGINIFPMK